MEDDIKVTVCVVTYNQGKFIRQCLQSLVDQKTSAKFDIIVSDDCSTDDTPEILKEFAIRYPEVVKPILHQSNIGPYKNFIYTHQQATGKYIAHMDGDDYALPGKLEQQIRFLDENPNCNIVWHPMDIEFPDGRIIQPNHKLKSELYSRQFHRGDIIKLIAIGGHSSKMYRSEVRDFELPSFDVVDYFANVEQVGEGYAAFTGENSLGVYRCHIGIASSGPKTRRILAKCFLYFCRKYPEYKLQANTASLTYLVADSKNFRSTSWVFAKTYCQTFHIFSFFEFLKILKTIKLMKA